MQFIYTHGGVFPVRRGARDEEMFITAETILARGGAITMYCEGGRSRTGKVAEQAKRGIGRLALETGAPVVPIAIHGSSRIRNWKRLQFPKVTVQYGDAMRWERDRATPRASSSRRSPTRSSCEIRGCTPAWRSTAARACSSACASSAGPSAARAGSPCRNRARRSRCCAHGLLEGASVLVAGATRADRSAWGRSGRGMHRSWEPTYICVSLDVAERRSWTRWSPPPSRRRGACDLLVVDGAGLFTTATTAAETLVRRCAAASTPPGMSRARSSTSPSCPLIELVQPRRIVYLAPAARALGEHAERGARRPREPRSHALDRVGAPRDHAGDDRPGRARPPRARWRRCAPTWPRPRGLTSLAACLTCGALRERYRSRGSVRSGSPSRSSRRTARR